MKSLFRLATVVAALSLLVLTTGCGPRMIKAKGKVMYKNEIVPGGILTLSPATGKGTPVTIEIEEDGTFPERKIPAGEVLVSFDNRHLTGESAGPAGASGAYNQQQKDTQPGARPGAPGAPGAGAGAPPKMDIGDSMAKMRAEKGAPNVGAGAKKGKYRAIPQKYYRSETSNHKMEVTEGELVIELKD